MSLSEKRHTGGFLLSEAPGYQSRVNGKLNSGQNLEAGSVVGQLITAAAVAGTNTGNGAVTIGVIGASAQIGVYSAVCVATASNAGTFNLYAPDGTLIRQITVGGATVSPHFTITIADGSNDFAAGDSFAITLTGGDFEQLDPTEDDGAQIAAGILLATTNATSADTPCVVIARNAEVNANEIVWPSGITDAQKATATAQLLARGLTLR